MQKYLNSAIFGALTLAIFSIALLGTMFASQDAEESLLAAPAAYDSVTNYGFPLTPVPEYPDEPQYVPTWTPVPPTATPPPIPTQVPYAPPAQSSVGSAGGTTSGLIPWFVPAAFHDQYLACLTSPERFNVSAWVYAYSVEGGREDGWHYDSAMQIVGREGGNDLCQFNTQGSGACGPFQTLTCPGLTPELHYGAAFAKYQDGARRNPANPWYAHWHAFWN